MISQAHVKVVNNYVDGLRRERAAEEAAKSPARKRADKILETRLMFLNVLCNRSINWHDDDDRMVWLKRALEDMRKAWFVARDGDAETASDMLMQLVSACPDELKNMGALLYALANEIEGHALECECQEDGYGRLCSCCKANEAEKELAK